MSYKRWPRRKRMSAIAARRPHKSVFGLLILLFVVASLIIGSIFLRNLITELAVSESRDVVVSTINDIVKQTLSTGDYNYTDLVTLEKDNTGSVTAVVTDVAAINKLATEILNNIINETKRTVIKVGVPLGNLTGNSLLLDRGPEIPVRIIMLTSSFAGFRSDLSSAGINQTRHRIVLELKVEVSLLMPWHTVNTVVNSEVLAAETVIVGQVPESYLNWGK